jgi:predicted transcriptional regulator
MIGKVKAEIELMKRHIEVMQAVVSSQPIGIMKLSELLDQPFHRVRYSLRVLEHLGYLTASPSGAVTTKAGEDLLDGLDAELDEMITMLETMKHQGSSGRREG